MDCIKLFSNVETALHSLDKFHLIWVYNSSYTLLDLICQHFVEEFCVNVHESYCFSFLSYSNFVYLNYNNYGFINELGNIHSDSVFIKVL